MHCLFLGIFKGMLREFAKAMGDDGIDIVYARWHRLCTPTGVTGLPKRFMTTIGHLKGVQLMSLVLDYGALLFDISVLKHQKVVTYFTHFVQACRIICGRSVERSDMSCYFQGKTAQVFVLCCKLSVHIQSAI